MKTCVNAPICVPCDFSLANFLICLFCYIPICLILIYLYFIMILRKGVNLNGRGIGRKWEEKQRRNLNQKKYNIKSPFSIKEIRKQINISFSIELLQGHNTLTTEGWRKIIK